MMEFKVMRKSTMGKRERERERGEEEKGGGRRLRRKKRSKAPRAHLFLEHNCDFMNIIYDLTTMKQKGRRTSTQSQQKSNQGYALKTSGCCHKNSKRMLCSEKLTLDNYAKFCQEV